MWGEEFLELALQIVYDQEVVKVKTSISDNNIESLKTVNK
jgi:hypothetical protein